MSWRKESETNSTRIETRELLDPFLYPLKLGYS